MAFRNVFHLSTYALVILGAVALAAAEGSAAFATLVVLSVVASHFFTLRWRMLALPRWLANAVSLALLPVVVFRPHSLGGSPQLALAHAIVLLQIVRLFQTKVHRDYWTIYMLSLFQVVMAALLSPSAALGALLVLYVLLAVWTLMLFCLWREGDAHRPPAGMLRVGIGPTGYATDADRRKFLSLRFTITMGLACVGAVLLTGAVFVGLPRLRGTDRIAGGGGVQAVTGFSEQVTLGSMGRILESDAEVMKIGLYGPGDQPYDPGPEPYWRGTVLTYYDGKRWWQPTTRDREWVAPGTVPAVDDRPSAVRQDIRIVPLNTQVLFSLHPVLAAKAETRDRRRSVEVRIHEYHGTLLRDTRSSRRPLHYTAYASTDPGAVRTRLDPVGRDRREWRKMLRPPYGARTIDPKRLDAVARYARQRLTEAGIPVRGRPDWQGEWIAREDFGRAAEALEAHLGNNPAFTYTLADYTQDASVDPIEDFLVNRKSGHCEYYASALTVMLQKLGVPARVATGFKGSDYNTSGRFHIVRQRHAHSWVEAFVPEEGRWRRLDPTPAAARLAELQSRRSGLQDFIDYVDDLWAVHVLGYNARKQREALFDPLKKGFRSVVGWLRGVWTGLVEWVRGVLHFPSVGSLLSWRGVLVGLVLLVLTVAGGWLVWRLLRWWRWRRWGGPAMVGRRSTGVEFYEQLLVLMQGLGLVKDPCQTPREFAGQCRTALADVPALAGIAEAPLALVSDFYAVRFGRQRLPSTRLRELRSALRSLRAALRQHRREHR